MVAAEDTRRTRELLAHFDIHKPLISCRAQNERQAARDIVRLLESGQSVAYTSDAGTPGVSDPGAVLVGAARAAGHHVVPIPGPSALTALMSVAGAAGKTLIFEGFVSPSPGKRYRRLQELFALRAAFVLYESPFRIVKLLADAADIESSRCAVIGRELTKLHEEIITGTVAELRDDFAARATIKGECTVLFCEQKA